MSLTINGSTGSIIGTLPAGMVMYFANSTVPQGWLKCNGAAISRTNYPELFSAIGTVYGVGDGSTTFNLPDLRGQFVRGWADNGLVDSGRAIGSNQTDTFPSHTHTIPLTNSGAAANNGPLFGGNGGGSSYTQTSNAAGTGTETRPVNVAMLACIKY